jgi:phage tail-like protein
MFTVDGVEIGVFSEVQGLSVSISAEPITEGGQNSYVHQLPTRMTWPNITFKRGLTHSDNLFAWMYKVSGEGFSGAQNKLKRCTGAISVITPTGTLLRSWNLRDVFPVSWTGPDFKADSIEPLYESLVVAHHGFKPDNHVAKAK